MHFVFGNSETICVYAIRNFPDAWLQSTLCSLHVFRCGSDTKVINIEIIPQFQKWDTLWCCLFWTVSLTIYSPEGLPLPAYKLEKFDPTRTQNFLSEIKLFMKLGNLSHCPKSIQVFHYSKHPGGLISLLKIKDCYKVLFLDVGLSYEGFQFDHIHVTMLPNIHPTYTVWLSYSYSVTFCYCCIVGRLECDK